MRVTEWYVPTELPLLSEGRRLAALRDTVLMEGGPADVRAECPIAGGVKDCKALRWGEDGRTNAGVPFDVLVCHEAVANVPRHLEARGATDYDPGRVKVLLSCRDVVPWHMDSSVEVFASSRE